MSKKKKKKTSAVRVDPKKAMLPRPSQDLIQEMAIGIQMAVAGHASVALDIDEPPAWEELRESVQEAWRHGARIGYSIIALRGGAKLQRLTDDDEGDDAE